MKIKPVITLAVLLSMGGLAFAEYNTETPNSAATSSNASDSSIGRTQQSPPATETSMDKPAQTRSKIKGTVEAINSTDNSVQIKEKSGDLTTVKVDQGVTILKAGKPVQLSELSPGDKVIIKMQS